MLSIVSSKRSPQWCQQIWFEIGLHLQIAKTAKKGTQKAKAKAGGGGKGKGEGGGLFGFLKRK